VIVTSTDCGSCAARLGNAGAGEGPSPPHQLSMPMPMPARPSFRPIHLAGVEGPTLPAIGQPSCGLPASNQTWRPRHGPSPCVPVLSWLPSKSHLAGSTLKPPWVVYMALSGRKDARSAAREQTNRTVTGAGYLLNDSSSWPGQAVGQTSGGVARELAAHHFGVAHLWGAAPAGCRWLGVAQEGCASPEVALPSWSSIEQEALLWRRL
jgi:hypothetical protein